MALPAQPIGEPGAEETGRAGHEDPHSTIMPTFERAQNQAGRAVWHAPLSNVRESGGQAEVSLELAGLQALLHGDQEAGRVGAVHDPVVVADSAR